MSEQQAEQSSGDTGSVSAGPAVHASSDLSNDLVTATMQEAAAIASPRIAPDHEAPGADAAKVDAVTVDASKPEISKPDTFRSEPRIEGAQIEAANIDTSAGKRRFGAMAAVVVLATAAGAIGGAMATAGLTRFVGESAHAAAGGDLEASIARIDSDILELKAGLEQTSKLNAGQFNKASDRLDKIEKALAEPAAKLMKLSEAVDKLRAASPAPVAAAPAAPKDVTGSVAPPVGAAALPVPAASTSPVPATAPKGEIARLPTVEGWVLRDVAHGGALIEGRRGLYEVYAGDPVPGLGRVDAIRRQDGRWVVVTSKGLIVAR